jgi:hypothetical protein
MKGNLHATALTFFAAEGRQGDPATALVPLASGVGSD